MVEYPHIAGIQFEGELGRGAHSVVFRGRQGAIACAVKLPRARARWSRWIYREAVSLARVKHPLLPTVLEVGDADGLPYLVMELVEGETLGEKLARGALDEDRVVAIARQLASVLAAVHGAGLVHRDVKPRNIVIERSTGALKLVDFGFATPMERVGLGDTAGTAAYAAPEQLSPPGRVDGRADLYAVGRVLFECLGGGALSGRMDGPFGAEARSELLAAGVSPGLAEIVAGLLRLAPKDRYPDASGLERDLERFSKGLPALGPSGYEPTRTPKVVARQSELERIVGPCRDHRKGGALVLVRGPRGGGKTSLLEAAVAQAKEFSKTIFVSCRQDDAPLAALRRVLEGYCDEYVGVAHGTAVEDLRAAIGNLAPVVQLIAPRRMLSLLYPSSSSSSPVPLPSDIVIAADSLAEGAAEILLRLASRVGPLVLAVDDAHWMDPASTDALLRVAHRGAEAPLMLVLASRTDLFSGVLEPFSEVRRARAYEVDIPRLTEKQVGELLGWYLQEDRVDPALVARIHAVAGGTPLGVFEVLGSFLDAGALRPHARTWVLDPARTDRVLLPQGALVLLGRRLGDLPPATRRVLEMAAIMGRSFDDGTLAKAIEVAPDDLEYAMAAARRAGLVEAEGLGRHRFVHDSLREMLIDDLSVAERRRLHQRMAEVLDETAVPSFEELCEAARHYAEGEVEKSPARWSRVARAAGEAALARFDNETAVRFLAQARGAADVAGLRLDWTFFRSLGEAQLRLGSLDESLTAFEAAFERATDPKTKALILGRLSWVYQTRAEPEQAWAALDRAFVLVGARMPVENLASAAVTSAHVAKWRLGRFFDRTGRHEQDDIDRLCQLHYQNARLGLEYNKPARLIQSSLESLELSERGGSEGMRARARAYYALVMTAFGRREAGARELSVAKEIAGRHADPATMAFCVQIQAMAASWAGDFDRSLVLFRECVDVHGPWLELNEFCLDISTGDIIESIRGRSHDAWAWVERAVERLRRSRTRPVVAEYLIHRARAALLAVGRQVDSDAWLAAQFDSVAPQSAGQGFHRLVSWGPRIRYYFELGDFGADFEDIVRAFDREGHNPRSAHVTLSEYYITVVHARIHQALRAPRSKRAMWVQHLQKALVDLRAAAKIPLFKAHRLLGDGALAYFEGNEKNANKLLSEAEALANQQSCPWVLYGVARMRAFMLREAGKEDSARDQARAAELFAREHGAATRARWVREEFGLVDPTPSIPRTSVSSRRSSSSRTNRQLTALLQVARAPRRDLKAEQQGGAILDELMSSLNADRGSIWFQPESGKPGVAVTRHRGNDVSVSLGADSPRGALLREVQQTGTPWPPDSETSGRSLLDEAHFDPKRLLAVPLFLYQKPVGAICLERHADDNPFAPDDRSLLSLLSHQVPIALEIARLLFEREQLHTSLQQAKKMEAMGQLAGGLAHDFNNMLAAMKVALSAARERAAMDAELTVELDVISQATTRAAQLTSQLLSFSRHQPVPVAVHDVNQLISTLEPMLRRVVGSKITVTTKLSPAVDAVEVDQGSFDQALVNLLINSRDAMPDGGSLSITTRNVLLDDASAQQVNLPPGAYVEVEVSDTGEGMSADTMSRIFEPFFTTKPAGTGSGLGLAMVYAFARNCGGSVDVSSELGKGTQFRLYLKRVARTRPSRPVRPMPVVSASPAKNQQGPDTILVVDDDDLVRRSIAKILERHGYRVVAASGSAEALSVAREQGGRIGLVILDVLMPGVTGPELGRRLYELNLSAKLLFVSGFSPESIPLEGAQVAAEMLLQKPFSQTTLLERVRQLMQN